MWDVTDTLSTRTKIAEVDNEIDFLPKIKYCPDREKVMVRNGMVSAYNMYNHSDYTVRATPTETSTRPSYYFGNAQDSTRFQYTWIKPIQIMISKKAHVQNNLKILSPYLITI